MTLAKTCHASNVIKGGATGGCGGTMPPPPLFGPGGTGGGTMKMIFASTAFSTVEVTEFQLP